MPDVSVVLATIRIDPWFEASVSSVLDQDDIDLELIVVLDGAVSEPGEAWRQDDRVHVIALQTRCGLAKALTVGVSQSTSAFVARLDADDLCMPERLRKQMDYLDANWETVLVATHAARIDEHGNVTGGIRAAAGDDIRDTLARRNPITHSSVMFRRQAYERAGGYDPSLPQMEDYDLWLRMAFFGKVAILPEELVAYRVHSAQMSRGAKPYGTHIDKVWSGQRNLHRLRGSGALSAAYHGSVWRLAQFARYWGIRKPGYDRVSTVRRPR